MLVPPDYIATGVYQMDRKVIWNSVIQTIKVMNDVTEGRYFVTTFQEFRAMVEARRLYKKKERQQQEEKRKKERKRRIERGE